MGSNCRPLFTIIYCIILTINGHTLNACKVDQDCDENLGCRDYQCQDPCKTDDCGHLAHTVCKVRNHVALCMCAPGYTGTRETGCRPVVKPDCTSSKDCEAQLACVRGDCVNPCDVVKCAPGAECRVVNHTADCECKPGLVISKDGCVPEKKPESSDEDDCKSSSDCFSGRCADPCTVKQCGPNSSCEVINLKARCKCNPGFVRDQHGCKPEEKPKCSSPNDCETTSTCVKGVCVDPCAVERCWPNSSCHVINHRAYCKCDPGFVDYKNGCTSVGEKIKCSSKDDCDTTQDCVGRFCIDPCKYIECGEGTVCKGVNHKAQCLREKKGCSSSEDCGATQACVHKVCVDPCEYIVCGAGYNCSVLNHKAKCSAEQCSSNEECGVSWVCVGGECLDPCRFVSCGSHSSCRVANHVAECVCEPGYEPDIAGCKPSRKSVACSSSGECGQTQACINDACTDPCNDDVRNCGPNVACRVIHHTAVCSCLPGFVMGDIGCKPKGQRDYCTSHKQCAEGSACLNGVCSWPCELINCGPNTVCYVVSHQARCSCHSGFIPGDNGCKPRDKAQKCASSEDCRRPQACLDGYCGNPCGIVSCGPNTFCNVVNDKAKCSCLTGFEPGMYGCKPIGQKTKCSSNTDCSASEACACGECSNPCDVTDCGFNTDCSVVNHKAVCRCKPGYERAEHGCKPQGHQAMCKENKECDVSDACVNGECVDPCELTDCGLNTICYDSNHRAKCACNSGYIPGDKGCKLPGPARPCFSDDMCSSQRACVDGYCANPCGIRNCGPNTTCAVVSHVAQCSCLPGYVPGNLGCKPKDRRTSCVTDSECDALEECRDGVCSDPCKSHRCGPNTVCTPTWNHRESCSCEAGFQPADFGCKPIGQEDECYVNPDCDETEACVNGMCSSPCVLSSCGPHTQCHVLGHTAKCACQPGFIPSDFGCQPPSGAQQCSSDSDCSSSEACINGYCANTCSISNCGPHSACSMIQHKAKCSCLQGFVPGNFGCKPQDQPRGCSSDNECIDSKKCINGVCTPPCNVGNCGPNTGCQNANHSISCTCMSGFIDADFGCKEKGRRDECRSNSECGAAEACVNGACHNPCALLSCGPNTVCHTTNHAPQCSCFPGYIPGLRGCKIPAGLQDNPCALVSCGPNTVCHTTNHAPQCSCFPGYIPGLRGCKIPDQTQPCSTNSSCSPSRACVDGRCADPCGVSSCGPHAECKVSRHRAKCACLPGYVFGNFGCTKKGHTEQCSIDTECSELEACVSGKCSDPCNKKECGPNSLCEVGNHAARCTCKEGYEPADFGCKPKDQRDECSINSECDPSKACINGMCVSPCAMSSCGVNTVCFVVNHKARCSCYPGLIPGDSGCAQPGGAHQCSSDSDCSSSEACINGYCANTCSISNCGPHSACSMIQHKAKCSCLHGFVPGNFGCKPQAGEYVCSSDGDCSELQTCINGVCFGSCDVKECGPHTNCIVSHHQALCVCRRGFEKDDFGCKPRGQEERCRMNAECSTAEACFSGDCHNPCDFSNCGSNAMCFVIDHRAQCSCLPGFIPAAFGCKLPGIEKHCSSVESCKSSESCVNGYCADPCGVSSCGPNATCTVVQHKADCSCLPGHVPGNIGCKPLRQPSRCKYSSDCSDSETCVNHGCTNACSLADCGPNTACNVNDHIAICTCKPGYVPAELGCTTKGGHSECSYYDQCDDKETCVNGECVFPCEVVNCGPNTVCQSHDHQARCSCVHGFIPGEKGCIHLDHAKKCSSNGDCGKQETCSSGYCSNPCGIQPCGPNTTCNVVNHQAECSCLPNYVPGNIGCKPGGETEEACQKDADCRLEEECMNGECVDSCVATGCGPYSACRALHHRPNCSCLPPFRPADVGCKPRDQVDECRSNTECDVTEACINGVCAYTCLMANCGPNTACLADNHKGVCSCKHGFIPTHYGCISSGVAKSCTSNTDCSSQRTCNHGYCTNPCGLSNCGPYSSCSLKNRKSVCSCFPGFVPGNFGCKRRAARGGCKTSDECGASEACINGMCSSPCSDPSTCGPNSECVVHNHTTVCHCKTGNLPSDVGCKPIGQRDECSNNAECLSPKVCVNGLCELPCAYNDCGPSTVCYDINQKAECKCLDGYIPGNKGCKPHGLSKKCSSNADCSLQRACVDGYCSNPCGISNCGPNSACTVAHHVAECSCLPGFVSSNIGCKPKGPENKCSRSTECSKSEACIQGVCSNPCDLRNCGLNTLCSVIDHKARCLCKPGFEPADIGCKPKGHKDECTKNPDCSISEACINGLCMNPCELSNCGPHSTCAVVSHKGRCSCLPTYIPGQFGCKTPGNENKCETDVNCELKEACMNGYCANPCGIANCGPNTECKVTNYRASCLCLPGFVPGNIGCSASGPEKKCSRSTECSMTEACIQGVCSSPCVLRNCGPNALCSVVDHTARCLCESGFDPADIGCKPKGQKDECIVNTDCMISEACINGLCMNPCELSNCGSHSTCAVVSHKGRCSCLPKYIPGQFGCKTPGNEKKCKKDIHCDLKEACIYGFCANPCGIANCGPNTECKATKHKASCFCLPGFVAGNIGCRASGQQKKCSHSTECSMTEACIQGVCSSPCDLRNCGPNALCSVVDHKARCLCESGFEPADIGCKPKGNEITCETDAQCDLKEACIYGFCANPCGIANCGPNTECKATKHKASCFCLPGFVAGKIGCRASGPDKKCSQSTECSMLEACIQGVCGNPCDMRNCGLNTLCSVIDHTARCLCKPGFEPADIGCKPKGQKDECTKNPDCMISEACINGLCMNPCELSNCGSHSTCAVVSHKGRCSCLPKYIPGQFGCKTPGNEKTCETDAQCDLKEACIYGFCANPCGIANCGPNTECKATKHKASCFCLPGFVAGNIGCRASGPHKKCSQNTECSKSEACIQGVCGNPCDLRNCGLNTLCSVIDHKARCLCKPGFEPADIGCKPKGQEDKCTNNTDCPTLEACINGLCMNPCDLRNCGPLSACAVNSHIARCSCLQTYIPGQFGCKSPGNEKTCETDAQCDLKEACIYGFCANPCGIANCGPNTECKATKHKASCFCLPGFVAGNIGCRASAKPCVSSGECATDKACLNGMCINPCELSSCGPNSVCTVANHLASCSCKPGVPGVLGDHGCNLEVINYECYKDDDCNESQACLNHSCMQPCDVSNCGANSVCSVVHHRANCDCKPGHVPVEGEVGCKPACTSR